MTEDKFEPNAIGVLLASEAAVKAGMWAQGTFDSAAGGNRLPPQRAGVRKHCLSGLLDAKADLIGASDAEFRRAREAVYLALEFRGCHLSLVQWNDTPGRTKEDVLSILQDASLLMQRWGLV